MNRPLIFLIGMVILIIYCFISFVKDSNISETLFSAYVGIGGALIGATLCGIVSGYYSYYGGLRAAEKNYELLRVLASEEKEKSENEHSRQLFAQLNFSYELITKSTDWVPVNGLIYDVEWYKHLAVINSLDLYQKEIITKWFHEIIMLQNSLEIEYRINAHKISESPLRRMMMGKPGCMQTLHVKEKFDDLLPKIKEIVLKNFWIQGTR